MKASIYTTYGPPGVLHLQEVNKPVPSANDVLIRLEATAVNSGDWRLRKADPFGVRLFFGLLKPKLNILGSVFSGVIESVGTNVQHFKIGDEVFGHTDMRFGAYAEYLSISESATLALKPKSLQHTEAAVIPFGGVAALHFIKKAGIQPGQKVLVYGASGAVGSAAVQLAKYFGANVTGVCSPANVGLVKSIGADTVIDYSKTNLSQMNMTYDVVVETVNKVPYPLVIRLLTKKGTLILSSAGMAEMVRGLWTSLTTGKRVLTGVIKHSADDIQFLKSLIDTGNLQPVIDKVYPLERMAEAHAYVEKGHKKGNVAITISHT